MQGGVRWERLTPQALEGVEFLELVYQPRAESNAKLYRHPGFEMVIVLEGRFDIYVGFEQYELGPGDSIAFASSLPHRYVNPTDSISRAITTILRDGAGASERTSRSQNPLGVRHPQGEVGFTRPCGISPTAMPCVRLPEGSALLQSP